MRPGYLRERIPCGVLLGSSAVLPKQQNVSFFKTIEDGQLQAHDGKSTLLKFPMSQHHLHRSRSLLARDDDDDTHPRVHNKYKRIGAAGRAITDATIISGAQVALSINWSLGV